MKPFKEEADFHFGLWNIAGRPQNTELHWAMKHSKNQYHYAVKRLKKSVNSIINNKFVEACLNGGIDIFKEIKNLKGQSSKVPSNIDGNHTPMDISNHFKDIYSDLYNSVPSDQKVNTMLNNINNDII